MTASMNKQQAAQWQAILNKDTQQNFVYGVTSTGIYCLPSCHSRKPKPQNVRFFGFAELAEKAGFRACKRCKPQHNSPQNPQLERVKEICNYLEEHSQDSLSLEHLAKIFELSASYIQRSFKQHVGISPQRYLEAYRMNSIKEALSEGQDIAAALYDAGYNSSSRLYSKANDYLGMTPQTYKKKGVSMLIHYSINDSPLGKLMVAVTEKGVCSVRLADNAETLKKELFLEFEAAEIHEDKLALEPWVNKIVRHLEGKEPHLELQTDVRATAFQQQVWLELQKIPYGETRSYSEVAKAMGKPKAVRAVASACAKNPTALIVPCHRVVRSDGSMGGFRWGLERKEALLKQERKQATT